MISSKTMQNSDACQLDRPTPPRQSVRWLVAYDICDPKRLQRIGRYMSKIALRIQLSVYLVDSSVISVEQVVSDLEEIIDPGQDDVRLYRLTARSKMWGLGQQFDEADNFLIDQWLERVVTHEEANVPN
jgi:CRISPR-associated protein Cas2